MIVERMGRAWEWPDYDEKLIQVFDWVWDCQIAIEHCKQRRLAIQAGGATGVWAAYLADRFDRVVTVEPEEENYRCLAENLRDFENITHFHGALMDKSGRVDLKNDPSEVTNCGTWHLCPGDSVRAFTIDSLAFDCCDLICLDVEGAELLALQGAEKTIAAHRPVIMLEEKPLHYIADHKPAAARDWLSQFGYKQVASIHRDIVLAC